MNTRQKLEILQKKLGLTQTKLAEKFGVSFAAFNGWWTGKSKPRLKMQAAIDELFLEVTGQKIIPVNQLIAKKQVLRRKDEALVLKLHSILMNGVRPDAGIFRNHAVRISGVNLPTANYMSVPKLMSEVITRVALKNKDVIAESAGIHSKFEQIHPFSDGNGRVGRLFMNVMLLSANFAPAIIRQEQKRLYYAYLYKAQTKDDHSQLEDFLCEAVADGFKILERTDIR